MWTDLEVQVHAPLCVSKAVVWFHIMQGECVGMLHEFGHLLNITIVSLNCLLMDFSYSCYLLKCYSLESSSENINIVQGVLTTRIVHQFTAGITLVRVMWYIKLMSITKVSNRV